MGKSSRTANPNPSDEIRIDVPYGYPVNPPSPPLSAGETVDCSMDSEDKRSICIIISCLVVLVVLFVSLAFFPPEHKLPRFQLDSLSVNVDGNSTAAAWDIGFSIDTSLRDLTVWVRFMDRDYKFETAGSAGNTTVSMSTLLPQQVGFDYSSGGLITLEKVMFRCNNYKNYFLEAACNDVAVDVGFSSTNETTTSSTRGVMKGGPRLCPIVDRQRN